MQTMVQAIQSVIRGCNFFIKIHLSRRYSTLHSSACQGKPYPRNFTSRIGILAIYIHPQLQTSKTQITSEYSYIIIKINLTTNQCQLTPRARDTFSIHPQIPSTTRLHDSSIRSNRTTNDPIYNPPARF
jgi:hypothetical protein